MTAVPDNYAFEPYDTLEDTFDDVAEFQVIGTGTGINSTEYVKTGGNSIKITPGVNSNVTLQKTEAFSVPDGL